MSTIFDVAERAGVSKSTVSRVISGKGSIKESTKKRIEQAMEELNFAPSNFAQGIRTGKSKTIAMVVYEPNNLYYNEVLYQIDAIAREHGYMVLFCNGGDDMNYITSLRQRKIDGIICCFYRDSAVIDRLYQMSADVPIVFLDNPLGSRQGVSYVGSDGLSDTAEIVRRLRESGEKSIAFVGIRDINNITYRYMGYRAGLIACGYTYQEDLVYMADYFSESSKSHFTLGYEAAQELMRHEPKPDAIVAATDMLAIGVLRYLTEAGYRVPEDVAVTGYDNIILSSMTNPSLSTASQNLEGIAKETMSILLHKIEQDNSYNRSVMLRSELIIRGSTK